jgi:hypothetical protein
VICFEVFLNDRRLCLAGVGEHGLLSQFLSWDSLSPSDRAPYQKGQPPQLGLLVNGRVSAGGETLHWFENDVPLAIGDEVRVRIIESDRADDPTRTTVREQRESARETRRRLYEALKQEFESGGAAA